MDKLTKQDFAGCIREDGTVALLKLYNNFYPLPASPFVHSYLQELDLASYIRSTQVALAVVAAARAMDLMTSR